MGRNSYEYILAICACLCGSFKLFFVDPESNPVALATYFKESDIGVLLYDDIFEAALPEYTAHTMILTALNLKNYVNDIEQHKSEFDFVDSPYDSRIVFPTSGTSYGHKKQVVLSSISLLENMLEFTKEGFADDKSFCVSQILTLPLFHIFAISPTLMQAIFIGNTTYISAGTTYLEREIKEYNPHYVCVVPSVLEYLYYRYTSKLENASINTKSDYYGKNLFRFICGGAKIESKILEYYASIGIDVFRGYGMTELSPAISITNAQAMKVDYDNVGYPLKCHDIKIVDGEICIKSNTMMMGYFKSPQLTEDAFVDNWFHTGDSGYIGENGLLYVTGRTNNVIVLKSGKKIIPESVEQDISNLDGVLECAVYSIDGSVLSIYIYCENMEKCRNKVNFAIEQYNSKQPLYKKIRNITIGDTPLPKTATNKIQRHKIADHAKIMDICNKLHQLFDKALYHKKAFSSYDLLLDTLHFDSLELLTISSEMEDKFRCKIDINFIFSAKTLFDIGEYVFKLINHY
jgi:long-chain acyl-CoA synthetase